MTDEAPVDGLTRLSRLADEQFAAETEVARLTEELREANDRVKRLSEIDIPALMEELEVDDFTTRSGLKVAVGDKLSAKKLTQAHAKALAWLRENNQGGLIKTNVSVPFTAGHETDADELVERLSGEGIAAAKGMEVHHSSLAAAVKKMLEAGEDVPLDLLGAYQRRVAKVTPKKR